MGLLLKEITGVGDQSLSGSFITILINVWLCFYFKYSIVQ